ncbi:MAG: hypothetical protein ACE5E4_09150 [Candidatus Binatia bacterium]
MCRRHPIQWAACLLVLVSLCVPRAILAGSTDPVLAIGQIRARPAGAGSVVEVFGTWEFDNLVQVDFPLNVVVSQGANFVRLPAGGLAAESGSFAGLLDGLDPAELVDLENAGLPESGAELLRVEPHLIKASIPPLIVDGQVSVVVYVVIPGEGSFVSNAVSVSLSGVGL